MPNYRLHHIHLSSPDPIKTAEFYEKMFGARRVSVQDIPDGRTLVNLDLNGSSIKVSHPRAKSLVPGAGAKDYDIEHFGVETDNIEAAVEEMKAAGVRFVQEIKPGLSARIAFCLAPGDTLIEILEKND